MTRTICLVFTFGLLGPALAGAAETPAAVQEKKDEKAAADTRSEPSSGTFQIRQIDFGASTAETDTASSRFREYRALPNGVVLPFVRFAGDQKFWYDVSAERVRQQDARYRVLARPGPLEIRGEYAKIPHAFGNDARSILQDVGGGHLAVSDDLQRYIQGELQKVFPPGTGKPAINFNFLNPLVTPSLNASGYFDLALLREQGRLDLTLTRDKPVEVRLTYFHEKRRGSRASGTAFGFANVVETPEPIDYRTQDLALSGDWTRSWGSVRGVFRYNQFTNSIPVQTFDNPFRATDSTDPNAYQAPGSSSIGGASFARISLPPDNRAVTGSLGVTLKFAKRTRLIADASLGEWTQDEPFIPFTTNTAIVTPFNATDVATLPARSLDGKMKTLSLSASVSSRPIADLLLTARLRRYDLDNQTRRIEFRDGYVRYDGVFEDIPRISVPYGYTTDNGSLSASYDIGRVNLEAGYRLDRWHRTFRETETTTQNVLYASGRLRAADWAILRATVETGSRDFEGLEIDLSEEASFLEHGAPTNLLAIPGTTLQRDGSTLCPAGTICNLRYDQAKKDIGRLAGHLELSPGGSVMLVLSYLKGRDDYDETRFGLVDADNEAISAEVDYTPHERLNLYGFYTRENISTFQRGRQSGATPSNNALDDWISEVDDTVDSVGGGATLGLVKDKVDLKLYGNYQKVDGNNRITSPVGGAPELARRTIGGIGSIPLFDDTRLYTLSAELAYRVTAGWTLRAGGWYENYVLRDSNTNDLTGGMVLSNYTPGSFFLAANDADYKAHVLYLRASYAW